MSGGVVTIELPSVPPSLNRSRGGNQGQASVAKQNRIKQELQQELWTYLRLSALPKHCTRITAEARLRFPVRRGRDEGNFSWLLEKALGDALQSGQYLESDTPDHYQFGKLEFEEHPGPVRTLVILTYRGN